MDDKTLKMLADKDAEIAALKQSMRRIRDTIEANAGMYPASAYSDQIVTSLIERNAREASAEIMKGDLVCSSQQFNHIEAMNRLAACRKVANEEIAKHF